MAKKKPVNVKGGDVTGKEIWSRARSSRVGAKRIFKTPSDLWDMCCDYFQWCADNPLGDVQAFPYQGEVRKEAIPKIRAMTISGLCLFLGVGRQTWVDYRNRKDEFSSVIEDAESVIRTQKFEGAAAGMLNPTIIARDLNLRDGTDVNHGGQPDNPLSLLLTSIDGNEDGLPNGDA